MEWKATVRRPLSVAPGGVRRASKASNRRSIAIWRRRCWDFVRTCSCSWKHECAQRQSETMRRRERWRPRSSTPSGRLSICRLRRSWGARGTRDRFPVVWTLASGDVEQEISEAEEKLARRLHRTFKVKVGAKPPAEDLARLQRLAKTLEGRAEFIVDANPDWDEMEALRMLL